MSGTSKTDIEYEIITTTETYRVIVPSDWKVTFGDVMPGHRNAWREHGQPPSYCLRMYESENKQRMLFNHVLSFRDTSVELKKAVVTRQPDADGNVWGGTETTEWEEVR